MQWLLPKNRVLKRGLSAKPIRPTHRPMRLRRIRPLVLAYAPSAHTASLHPYTRANAPDAQNVANNPAQKPSTCTKDATASAVLRSHTLLKYTSLYLAQPSYLHNSAHYNTYGEIWQEKCDSSNHFCGAKSPQTSAPYMFPRSEIFLIFFVKKA